MQKTNEDCFYFLTSTCAKGSSCTYRHHPTARTCNVICSAWSRGNCTDPVCSLRHSTIQRPVMNNGTTCFYENTPMGCLKPDCSFVHLRSRPNLRNSPIPRPSTTNLVNKSSPVINEPVQAPQTTPVLPVPPKVETPPTPKVETPPAPKVEVPPPIKVEPPLPAPVIPPAAAKPIEIDSTTRNVVVNAPAKTTPNETKVPTRTVVNRNVVIGDTNRKVVQANRVVVPPSKSKHDSDSDLEDLVEQENDTKKTNGVINISFPCSAPSITNRLFISSKASSSTTTSNDTKPIRLNRDLLPATKISSPNTVTLTTNGEKTSAGTGLPQDEERRTNRIERFKKTPISPTRSVVTSSPNERKRPAPDQTSTDSPPLKRLPSEQDLNRHQNSTATIGELCSPPTSPRRTNARHQRRRRRSSPSPSPPPQRKSPLRQAYSATPSMNDSTWKKEVDEFLAKTTQPKPVPLLSLRPRFAPPPMQRQPLPAPPPRMFRPQPRQPTSVPNKRPFVPSVITPPEVSKKPPEVSIKLPEPVPPTPEAVPTTNSKEDDENRLLGLNEPNDVVDAFALIDEVLLETDDFFELM